LKSEDTQFEKKKGFMGERKVRKVRASDKKL